MKKEKREPESAEREKSGWDAGEWPEPSCRLTDPGSSAWENGGAGEEASGVLKALLQSESFPG